VRDSFARQRSGRCSQRIDELDVAGRLVDLLRRDVSERLVEPAERRSIGRIDLERKLRIDVIQRIDLLVERIELLDDLRRDEESRDGASR
jgi:hypothetical protein